jgi:AcrR family transcriptional regulator
VASIVAAAWDLAHREGIGGVTLHGLARAVGMRQPSLYAYFDSKNALFDAMFADGNRQLLEMAASLPNTDDPVEALVVFVEAVIRFSTEDPVRHQLLFQHAVPGFEPSPESYDVAQEFYELARERVLAAGASTPDDLDLFTAMVAGLTHQQVANDPGGDRWVRLSRRAVEMYVADVGRRSQSKPTRSRKATR